MRPGPTLFFVFLSLAASIFGFETPLTGFLEKFPSALVIEGELAVHSTFIVTEHDKAFTEKVGDSLRVRNYANWHNGQSGLLLTRKKPSGAYTARYEMQLKEPRVNHQLWLFEQGRDWSSPLRWRIGTQPWVSGKSLAPMQNYTQIAPDGPVYCWTYLGNLSLPRGRHTLEVEITHPRQDGLWLFGPDCFVLTPPPPPGMGPPFNSSRRVATPRTLYLYDSTAAGGLFPDDFRPSLEPYLCESDSAAPAVIICPGGAYRGLSTTEAQPFAKLCAAAGVHAFVLDYRVWPHTFPVPQIDAARAVRLVRSRARQLRVDPKRIALCGFSAGGHLAASVGVLSNQQFVNVGDSLDSISARPDALILIYPVIASRGPAAHQTSMANLLGSSPGSDVLDRVNLFTRVGTKTPPTFLIHAFDDPVSVENTLLFADALRQNAVPFELHVYPKGGHGFGTGEGISGVEQWPQQALRWLQHDAFSH